MFEIALFLLVFAVVPIGIALGLSRIRPRWPRLLRAAIAGGLVPLLIMGLCVFMFLNASWTPADRCGVDACGMAMAAAVILGGFAALGLVIGVVAAFVAQKPAKS